MHLGLEGFFVTALWVAEIAAFLLSVFWRPAIGIYVLLPLMPLQTVRYKLHGMFLGEQFVDILLLGVVLGLMRKRQPVFPSTSLNRLLLYYIGFTYLSMCRGSFFIDAPLPLLPSDPRLADWKNYVVALPMVFFLTTSAIRTRKQMVLLLLILCGGVLLLDKNYQSVIADTDFSRFSYESRTAGAMGYAGVNGFAAFQAQFATFILALFLLEKRLLLKTGYLAVIAASIYLLVLALSRGGYLAMLTGIVFLASTGRRWLFFALIGFLLTWQGLVPEAVRDRVFMTRGADGAIESSANERLSLWEEALQVFQADPIFGTGFNTYAYGGHVGGYRDSHNLFVKVLVETGLTGLILFSLILRQLYRLGWTLYRSADDPFLQSIGLGFAGLVICAVIANLFGDRWMYFQITGYTFAFAALCARGLKITEEEQESDLPDESECTRELDPVLA